MRVLALAFAMLLVLAGAGALVALVAGFSPLPPISDPSSPDAQPCDDLPRETFEACQRLAGTMYLVHCWVLRTSCVP